MAVEKSIAAVVVEEGGERMTLVRLAHLRVNIVADLAIILVLRSIGL